MKHKYFIMMPVAALVFLTACGGGNNTKTEIHGVDSNGLTVIDQSVDTFYQVPAPSETFSYIKVAGGLTAKKSNMLYSTADFTKANNKQLALGLGIYSADLSYSSVAGLGAEALKYFKIVNQLTESLKISAAVKPGMQQSYERNQTNADSLTLLTNDIYLSVSEILENTQQNPTRALIAAAGWVESLYILTNLTAYQANNDVVEHIADQKYALENLLGLLHTYESNADVATLIPQLTELQVEFNKLMVTELPTQTKNNKGITLLSGGNDLLINAENFKAITEKIKAIRNAYILTQ
ncbi:MAG: hypothetical protein V4538_13820 [Bacteroidota bacterium]